MPPIDFGKMFDVGRWFETQPGPASPWYVVIAVVFAILIVIGMYLYNFVPNGLFRNDRYRAMLARNIGQGVLWLAIPGVFVAFFRILDVGFFGMRLWLVIDGLIALGLSIYLAVYFRRVYPKRIAAIEKDRQLRAFYPKTSNRSRRHHHSRA